MPRISTAFHQRKDKPHAGSKYNAADVKRWRSQIQAGNKPADVRRREGVSKNSWVKYMELY